MRPQLMYFASFTAANGKRRYVGEGATMPWTEGEAKLFATKDAARLAAALVAPHHKADVPAIRVQSRKVIIAHPLANMGLQP